MRKKGRREYQVFSDFSYNSRILGWLTSLVSEPQLTADSYQIFSYSSDYLLMFTNLCYLLRILYYLVVVPSVGPIVN